jgi:hypothetical protein
MPIASTFDFFRHSLATVTHLLSRSTTGVHGIFAALTLSRSWAVWPLLSRDASQEQAPRPVRTVSSCLPANPAQSHSHVVWIPASAGMTESWRVPWRGPRGCTRGKGKFARELRWASADALI